MTTITDKILGSARKVVCTPLNRLLNRVDRPVIVLMYHRITTLSSDPEMLAVTPENFRAQLRYLKENVALVRFEEDWTTSAKRAVAITFDDGYADNALEALPIIEEVGVPATFFVSTGTIGTTREFWWDELGRILERQGLPANFILNDNQFRRKWPTGSSIEREMFYHEIVGMMNNTDPERRERWLAQLRPWAQCENETGGTANRAMTVDELRSLAESSRVTIGAHTVTHSRLSSLTTAAQREEITASKRQLETWLGREVTVFSYPFGKRSDFTYKTQTICREAGFIKAAANFPGQAHGWTNPYRIPRLIVRNWSAEVFAEKLRGFWIR